MTSWTPHQVNHACCDCTIIIPGPSLNSNVHATPGHLHIIMYLCLCHFLGYCKYSLMYMYFQERSSSKGRSKPAKSVAKVSSEHVSDPPTLPAKKSSRSTKAPKGNIAAPKRDSKEVESLEVGPPPIAKVEQETELSEPCKASPRGFDLNLDPKAEGDDLGHDNNSLDEVLEPRSFMVPKLEVVLEDAEVGVGELVPSYVEPPTTLVTTFKPMSVEEDDDYDCND